MAYRASRVRRTRVPTFKVLAATTPLCCFADFVGSSSSAPAHPERRQRLEVVVRQADVVAAPVHDETLEAVLLAQAVER